MNLIWICSDTFRNDHLGCMGRKDVQTPHLDEMASKGVLFEEAYAEGLPTIPERLVHMTGKFTLPFRGWSPLTDQDITMPEHLQRQGFRTALMADTYHLFKPGYNFHRGFDEWRWIRGQEMDPYVSARKGGNPWNYLPDRTDEVPLERKFGKNYADAIASYLDNIADRGDDESEYFPGQTIGEAVRWLEENRDVDRFLLWVELFDPHEPWDPPRKYYEMYGNEGYEGPNIIIPVMHSVVADDYGREELEDLKALYAGEVSLVDHWVGVLLDKVQELDLEDETAILFTSDHGTMLGERGCVTKSPQIKNTLSQYIANVPLIIKSPNGPSGLRIKDLVWSPDFMPTCYEILGMEPPETVHGSSFWDMVQGNQTGSREYVIAGWGKKYQYVVDDQWRYVANNQDGPPELYDKDSDPEETNNLAQENPDICNEMEKRLLQFWTDARELDP